MIAWRADWQGKQLAGCYPCSATLALLMHRRQAKRADRYRGVDWRSGRDADNHIVAPPSCPALRAIVAELLGTPSLSLFFDTASTPTALAKSSASDGDQARVGTITAVRHPVRAGARLSPSPDHRQHISVQEVTGRDTAIAQRSVSVISK